MTGSSVDPECAAVLGGISAYLDGELDDAGCDAIESHCRTCESCGAIVEGLRDTIGLCRHAADAPVPDAVRQKARASIDALLRRDLD
jgi:anti-sigma factor RsiW